MERKQKLAQLILMEIESLKAVSGKEDVESIEASITLAEEITKDALELALLIAFKAS